MDFDSVARIGDFEMKVEFEIEVVAVQLYSVRIRFLFGHLEGIVRVQSEKPFEADFFAMLDVRMDEVDSEIPDANLETVGERDC